MNRSTREQHPSSFATQGIRGTASISWEWGPCAGPSGSYAVYWRAIPGLTSWPNC